MEVKLEAMHKTAVERKTIPINWANEHRAFLKLWRIKVFEQVQILGL